MMVTFSSQIACVLFPDPLFTDKAMGKLLKLSVEPHFFHLRRNKSLMKIKEINIIKCLEQLTYH